MKSVGPRMELWGTPALTRYSYEDVPSITPWSHLLLRKEEVRPNIWPEIPEELGLWRRPAWKTLSTLWYIKHYGTSSPISVKSPSNSVIKTVRRSPVDREDLKPCWKSKKRSHFSRRSKILLFTKFSDFTNHRKKTNKAVILPVDLSPTFLNAGITDEFPTIRKIRLLQTHIDEFNSYVWTFRLTIL